MNIFRRIWDAIKIECIPEPHDSAYYDNHYDSAIDPYDPTEQSHSFGKVLCWCPYCTYAGTAEEMRCHLLNHHKP